MSQRQQQNHILCGGCKQNKGTKKCGGCKQTYYCSQKCQAEHWKDHKTECKKIRKQNKVRQQNKQKKDESNNSFASNIKKQYEKEKKHRRTPRIKVTKAINGIFTVRLLNEFLKRNLTDRQHISFEFQFDYKLFNDNQWKTSYFTSHLLTPWGAFWVRMPLNLKGYYIKCRLRARVMLNDENKNNSAQKWFDFSKEHKVSIPSSMIGTEFDVGDIVRYKQAVNYILSWNEAKIIEKLPNGYLKLLIMKDAYTKTADVSPIKIHSSNVFVSNDVKSHCILDFTNLDLNIDKTLLLKLSDNSDNIEKMRVYKSLIEIYKKYARVWIQLNWRKKVDFYIGNTRSVSIAKYVSLYVMGYLYEINEYEWKIDSCILDHTHGPLKCVQCLRAYLIKENINKCMVHKGLKQKSNIDLGTQICNICSVNMDQFEYVYHCSTEMENRHDICLNCIYSMIKQSEELNELLIDILANSDQYKVNNDCIDVIVTFVVGKVVKV